MSEEKDATYKNLASEEIMLSDTDGAVEKYEKSFENKSLPVVRLNPEIHSLDGLTEILKDHIMDYNAGAPKLFRANGSFCRIQYDDNGSETIYALDTKEKVTNEILKICTFKTTKEVRGGMRDQFVNPPQSLINNIMCLSDYGCISPTLIGITNIPPIDEEGKIQTTKGYNSKTRLYFDGSMKLNVPEEPTDDDIRRAREVIEEPFGDFPFKAGEQNKTHTYTMLITGVIRPSIVGNVPIHAVNKPTAGLGASLISDVVATVVTGKPAMVKQYKPNDEEIEKLIIAALRERPRLLVFDNVKGVVESTALASAVTAKIYSGRKLQESKNLELINTACFILNGINIGYSNEITRRVVEIQLETEMAEYWRADRNYKHPALLDWVAENRIEIISAIYTLYRAWIQRGCCNPAPTFGHFEEWARIMNGICNIAGWNGLLIRPDDAGAYEDPATSQWREFVDALYAIYKGNAFTVKEIIARLDLETDKLNAYALENRVLYKSLPDDIADAHDRKGQINTKLGQSLNKNKRRNFGGNKWIIKLNTKADGNKTKFMIQEITSQSTISNE